MATPEKAPIPNEQVEMTPIPPTSQQPIAQTPMNMDTLTTARNSKGMPYDATARRKWTHTFCSWPERCGLCFKSCCCPCVVYGQNHSRLNHIKQHNRPHPNGGEGCGTMTWAYCVLQSFTGLGWVMQFIQRGQIRERYSISGNGFLDCCGAFLCWHCCQQVQEARELEEEETFLRVQPNN